MINAILKGIFNIITKLILLLLTPINSVITSMLPGFNSVLVSISSFFQTCFSYVTWVLDSLFINSETISFLILYWVFKLTFPLAVYTFKLIVKWYDKLKV